MVDSLALQTVVEFDLAQESTQSGALLRYKADRYPVSFVLIVGALHFAVWWFATPWMAALATVPLAVLSMFVAAMNHHHQHVNVFKNPVLNRVYDIVLALQSGLGPYAWVLHHNFGHHAHYLNQHPHSQPDESRWTRKDGSQMGRVEYTLHTFFMHPVEIHRVGKRVPGQYRNYLLMKIPYYAIIAVMVSISPLNFLFAFFIPGLVALLHTCWATYEHHAGHYPSDHFDASVNREHDFFNFLTCNLGLHTAHHFQPATHWSLLPEVHAQLRSKIPEHQLLKTFW